MIISQKFQLKLKFLESVIELLYFYQENKLEHYDLLGRSLVKYKVWTLNAYKSSRALIEDIGCIEIGLGDELDFLVKDHRSRTLSRSCLASSFKCFWTQFGLSTQVKKKKTNLLRFAHHFPIVPNLNSAAATLFTNLLESQNFCPILEIWFQLDQHHQPQIYWMSPVP